MKGLSLTLAAAAVCAAAAPDWQRLLDRQDWFELRKAAASHAAPERVKAALASVFHRDPQAVPLLEAVIAGARSPREAEEARSLLINLHFRAGRYASALRETEEAIQRNANRADLRGARAMFAAMRADLAVASSAPDRGAWRMIDGNLFTAASINGVQGEYLVDTGANISLLSASEARRLGLSAGSLGGPLKDAAGGEVSVRAAIAPEMRLGGVVLKNAAFGIVSDDQQPFVALPEGKRGVLGIPVLIALGVLSWSKDGGVATGGASSGCADANMVFAGAMPLVRGEYSGVPLTFELDTGATRTSLWPAFAKRFPRGLEKSASVDVTGIASSRKAKAARLPSFSLALGGRTATLQDVRLVLDEKSRLAGRVGMDMFADAERVTLDFASMCIAVE
ncbi:MAG: aspartyl protease family protein [Bryobacteraceae bacterium]|nr:aspartyl protease family protein [Bryobacteraceae bacterium]